MLGLGLLARENPLLLGGLVPGISTSHSFFLASPGESIWILADFRKLGVRLGFAMCSEV